VRERKREIYIVQERKKEIVREKMIDIERERKKEIVR
jgi:hypothetical protein